MLCLTSCVELLLFHLFTIHATSHMKQQRHVSMSPSHLPYVIQTGDFRAQTSVHAEELLVEERSQRQAVERLHAGVVYLLRVLYFT